jgi:hypothetical protein
MGYWNCGLLGVAEEIYLNMVTTDKKLKSGHHPLFIPNIPYFHHAIFPLIILRPTSPLGDEVKSDPPDNLRY